MLQVAEGLLENIDDEELELIIDEWRDYQAAKLDLPKGDDMIVDLWWSNFLKTKDYSGNLKYPHLSKLIKILLILPYNQAPVERVISMVNKIDTKFRPTISNKSLNSLLTCKINNDNECFMTEISGGLLQVTRSACTKYRKHLAEAKI